MSSQTSLITTNGSIQSSPYITAQRSRITTLAKGNIEKQIGCPIDRAIELGMYSGPEIQSMIVFEALSLTSGMEIANIVIRGELIQQIHDQRLHSLHPEKFRSPEEGIESKARISRTKQSNLTSLNEIIFPYLERILNIQVEKFWNNVGDSMAWEIIPYLRCLITKVPSKSEKVNEICNRLLAEVDPEEVYTDDDRRRMAVKQIIDDASLLTVNQLREKMEDEETPTITAVILHRNGSTFLLAEISNDQLDIIGKNKHFELAHLDLRKDPPLSIPTVKRLMGG